MHRSRALLHAASGLALGTIWFSVLVTLWSSGIGMAFTLLGLPVIWLTLVLSQKMATVEAHLANSLLDTDIFTLARRGWALMSRLRETSIWHAQLYLLLRFVLGLITGTVLLGLVIQGLGLIVAPAWYWAIPDGIDLGLFRVDTIGEAVAVIPLGAVLVALGWWLAGPYAALWRRIAIRLLHGGEGRVDLLGIGIPLWTTVALAGLAEAVCLIVWAATGAGYAWPAWPAVGFGMLIGLHAGARLRNPWITTGVWILANVVIWGLAGGGYFWPVWVALGLAVVHGVSAIAGRALATERVQQLTRSRADVVNAQEDELRRIERDLHDGAQARLVSLSMSLGLAESRLDDDPERARELMSEAQDQARTALRELRDLARGIAPPVLQDRGLTAAIEALTATSTIPVDVRGDRSRAPAAIERAGYFVAAEAIANASKHAQATRLRIDVTRFGDRLEVQVADDGTGGANPRGSGLEGLRRRIEAVDGRLEINSPAGHGTIIRASLPCASS